MNQYTSIFKDKEIWITEWNLQMTKTTGNTIFQSLFVVSLFIRITRKSKFTKCKNCNYHNLAGRDVPSILKVKMDLRYILPMSPLKYIRDVF